MLRDRIDAGRRLAQMLRSYTNAPRCVVVALPRGGVVVGAEIARILHLPLDVRIVRKLGVPWQPELAFGAIASGGVRILHHDLILQCAISVAEIDAVTVGEQAELERRQRVYCGDRPVRDYSGWQAIVVDDGIATGATLEAALQSLRAQGVARLVVAVGVAQRDSVPYFQRLAEEVVAAFIPDSLGAISCWYERFPQTSDEEVTALLRENTLTAPPGPGEGQP